MGWEATDLANRPQLAIPFGNGPPPTFPQIRSLAKAPDSPGEFCKQALKRPKQNQEFTKAAQNDCQARRRALLASDGFARIPVINRRVDAFLIRTARRDYRANQFDIASKLDLAPSEKLEVGHEGWAWRMTRSMMARSSGSIAYAGEDFVHLEEIYLRESNGHIRQLTHMQQGLSNTRLAPATIFKTKSFDGMEIEAAQLKPPASHERKMPLVLLVHGGPSSNFTAGYSWETAWGQMLATHGYEVLMVNPRGSNGYSEAFLKANRGDWGGGDYKDLLAVLDAVLAKGETDPERLGIGGWSYGGEMAAWAITQSNRFRAAVSGAGVFDQAAEFETEDGPAGDEWYFGTPWEHPDVFARNSPSTFIRNARTPTLILDGEEDSDNPVGQSEGLYRALKHFAVETQLVLYPGEGHSPRKGSYNIDMFQRILDWYDRHLGKPH
jgi:dipeptidyl aminopeptidase/acylaminoacyl peptidase